MGQETQIDLFEHYELLPKNVQKIIEDFGDSVDTYEMCEKLLSALIPYGYTFDYYLNAEPFNLRKI